MKFLRLTLPLLLIAGVASSCTVMKTKGNRASGQSQLMDDTFAGQNACNPDNHDRPFIVEWDATDMSSFEQYAANDVVIVKYEGCTLKVMDECRNDSIRGSQGAYKPPEWTSGQLESIDIKNAGDLYAKLPLGKATLGGRVSAGEQFHMEYYVAGTRTATRDSVYRADLESNPGCEGATHFVYGYNLGAFALGSAKEFKAEAGGSAFGFGAGGSQTNSSRADKKGGDLAVCKSDSATEIEGCKAPIRLSLRKIRDGEDPNKEAMKAPDTDEALNAAGQVNMKIEMSEEARARLESAMAKAASRDGKGCLAELDAHDVLDAKHKSSDPKSGFGLIRAQCVMLAGKCDAGKQLARKSLEQTMTVQTTPEQLDRTVEAYGTMWCQGKLSDRDTVLQALNNLQQGAFMGKKPVSFCEENYQSIKKLKGKVKPKDDDDTQIINLDSALYSMVPLCFQRAGDCDRSRSVFEETFPSQYLENIKDPEQRKMTLQSSFESMVPKCKAK